MQSLRCLAGLAACRLLPARAGPDWLPAPRLPAVTLRDGDDQAWTLAEAVGGARVVVVSFFFTGCRTACPPQTALLREAAARATADGQARGLRMLGLSVDPLGDGPAQLRDFARRFELPQVQVGHHPSDGRWLLLSGEPAAMARALDAFGSRTPTPEAHANLIWVGDVLGGRWTRSSALNPPESLVGLIQTLGA